MPESSENIRIFLENTGMETLCARGVINGEKRLLTGASVKPLIELMLEKGVARLYHNQQWSLDARDSSFINHFNGYYKSVLILKISNAGDIFKGANRHINPFYVKQAGGSENKIKAITNDVEIKTATVNGGASYGLFEYGRGAQNAGGRTINLNGAGEMNEMINALPLNRKERYWTSCVFPDIVCGDKFGRLNKLLNLTGAPDKFIKPEYSNSDICFYTEYSLKESALDWPEIRPLRRDTPDIVILLRAADGDKFLIAIEAKMYDYILPEDLIAQMARQAPVINAILYHNGISDKNYIHSALVFDKTEELKQAFAEQSSLAPDSLKLISWKEIVDIYRELDGRYFYEMLKIACANPQLMTTREAYLRRNLKYRRL